MCLHLTSELGARQVAMEFTGVLWRPVYHLLEADHNVILVNAQPMKAVPGRKTDVKDAEWIADLLRHGRPLLRQALDGASSPCSGSSCAICWTRLTSWRRTWGKSPPRSRSSLRR